MEARRKRSEELAAKTPNSQEEIAYFRSLVSSQHPKQTKSIKLKAKTHGFSLVSVVSVAGVCLLNTQLNLPTLWSLPGRKPAKTYGAYSMEVLTLIFSLRKGGTIIFQAPSLFLPVLLLQLAILRAFKELSNILHGQRPR